MPVEPQQKSNKPVHFLALGAWLCCCAAATAWVTIYSHTPNDAGAAQPKLADGGLIQLDQARPTVVMFVHPRCPCTQASVEGLARLQRKFQDRFALRVVFNVPRGMAPDWHQSTLWDSVGRLPDCERLVDMGGHITNQAGAETSGTVALYEPDGRLVFWGGVTASRGHAGDSPGSDALASYFKDKPFPVQTDIFGCQMSGPDDLRCETKPTEHCPFCKDE